MTLKASIATINFINCRTFFLAVAGLSC